MNGASRDYTIDLPYPSGYYNELSLPRLRLALLRHGWAPPDVATACELGFGQGVSLAIHAAASPATWHGADINPDHVAATTRLTQASGVTTHLHLQDIVDFARRPDLPDFDFIALNGVWSWVSDDTRAAVADLARRRLKPGGVLFASYITLPGWAPFQPIRDLLAAYAGTAAGEKAPLADRTEAALEFARRLRAAAPGYLQDNPAVGDYLAELEGRDRTVVAHDLFNHHYRPMPFSAVADRMAEAGLAYAGSADVGALDALRFTPPQQRLLASVADPVIRECVKDVLVNCFARRDYFIKQPAARLTEDQRRAALRETRFISVRAVPDLPAKMRALLALQAGGLTDHVVRRLLERLRDPSPVSVRQAEELLQPAGAGFEQALDFFLLATGQDQAAPLQTPAETAKCRRFTSALNAHLAATAAGTAWRASPVTGAGVPIDHQSQGLLAALEVA